MLYCRCLAEFGIYPASNQDELGKLKFHSDNPLRLMENDNTLAQYYHVNISDIVIGNVSSYILLKICMLFIRIEETTVN
jgi:hypothetical protein